MEIPLIKHFQLPTKQLGVLQDRHNPLHRMHIVSCRDDFNFLILQQQQNLGRRFGTSKMHLSLAVA